jgi:hypothetical protein
MSVNDASRITIDDSRVMLQIVASLADQTLEASFTIIISLKYRPLFGKLLYYFKILA